MDIVRDFIKDQFNDEDEYYGPQSSNRGGGGGGGGREHKEVQHLKKELEELKFYQELERTEYEDMKRKMYTIEKKKNQVPRPTDTLQETSLFSSQSDETQVKQKLEKKVARRDEEINRLKEELKSSAAPKEFGKRMVKLEKAKNLEIRETKEHYKGLMEQLAKQIQKANDRQNDEVKKVDKLRGTMEEMRADMASREQELEDKLVHMEARLKKAQQKIAKLESSLSKAEENLANNQIKFTQAVEHQQLLEQRLRDMEEDFEVERKDIEAANQEEMTRLHDEISQKNEALNTETQAYREKMDETLTKLDTEERAHQETASKLKKTEDSLEIEQEENEHLVNKVEASENEARLYRLNAQKDIEQIEVETRTKLSIANEKIDKLTSDKSNLTKDLTNVSTRLYAAEKRVELMNDSAIQKGGCIRRKNIELEELQLELREACDKHIKDLKARDLQFVKEKKKWVAQEHAYQKEFEDIKRSPVYQRMLNESRGNLRSSGANQDELKSMVEQLRAEKTSLLLEASSLKEKSVRDIKNLQSKLKIASMENTKESSVVNYGDPYATKKPSSSFSHSLSKSVSHQSHESHETSSTGPEVSTNGTKTLAFQPNNKSSKSLSSSVHRRQIRQRKFAAKAE